MKQAPANRKQSKLRSSGAPSRKTTRAGSEPIHQELRFRSREFLASNRLNQDRLLALLRKSFQQNGIALYLGAGVSASAGFPTWPDLIKILMGSVYRDLYSPKDEIDAARGILPWRYDTFEKAAERAQTENNRPLVMMARMLETQFGKSLPLRIAATLYWYSYIGQWLVEDDWPRDFLRGKQQLDADLMGSHLIQAIANLTVGRRNTAGVRAIVNYNYDDLVDELIRQSGVACRTAGSARDRVKPDELPCYHVHGVMPLRRYISVLLGHRGTGRRRPVAFPAGNFVFSEEQYHREYSEPFRWSNLVQTTLLGAYDGLFIGLSMEDPNIRRLLDATHRQYPYRRNFAVLKRKRPLKSAGRGLKDYVINFSESVESQSFASM